MTSKIMIALLLTVAVATALPAQPAWGGADWGASSGVNPWIPPWVAAAPWYPQWTPCTTVGSECIDCTTRLVCTKIGGLQKSCTDPSTPYCNLGKCSATPTAECTPAPVAEVSEN